MVRCIRSRTARRDLAFWEINNWWKLKEYKMSCASLGIISWNLMNAISWSTPPLKSRSWLFSLTRCISRSDLRMLQTQWYCYISSQIKSCTSSNSSSNSVRSRTLFNWAYREQTNPSSPFPTSIFSSTNLEMCYWYAHLFSCSHVSYALGKYCSSGGLVQTPCEKRDIWQTIRICEDCEACVCAVESHAGLISIGTKKSGRQGRWLVFIRRTQRSWMGWSWEGYWERSRDLNRFKIL